jgi:hypothetical protein
MPAFHLLPATSLLLFACNKFIAFGIQQKGVPLS